MLRGIMSKMLAHGVLNVRLLPIQQGSESVVRRCITCSDDISGRKFLLLLFLVVR